MAHSTWNKPLGRESIGYEYWVVPSPSKSYNLSKLSFRVLRFWRPSEGRMLSLIINEANTFSCTRQNNMDFRKSFSTSVSSTSFSLHVPSCHRDASAPGCQPKPLCYPAALLCGKWPMPQSWEHSKTGAASFGMSPSVTKRTKYTNLCLRSSQLV